MFTDPFTGRLSCICGSVLGAEELGARLSDHYVRGLEALNRLCAAAQSVGIGTHPDDDIVLFPEDELSLLAGADALWGEMAAAVNAWRAWLPIVPLDVFGFPEDSDDAMGEGSPHLRRIGSGVEATAFQCLREGSIYKFYLPRDHGRIGGTFAFSAGSDIALQAEAITGSYRDLIDKLALIIALDGMPTELVGVTPEGILIAKQTLGALLAENADTSGMQPRALIAWPSRFLRAHRDHPRLYFWRDAPWLVADLHSKNLVRDSRGNLRAIDLLAAPVPPELVGREPLLATWLARVALDPEATVLAEVDDDEL